MDHDAMHKDVAKLKSFRDRAEKVIAFVEGLQAAGFKTPENAGGGDGTVADEFNQFKSDTDDRLKRIEQNFTDWSGRLDQVSNAPQAAVGSPLDDGVKNRLEEMLTWFDANREGLEILLSLDGDPDTDTGTSGNTVTGDLMNHGGTDGAGTGLDGSQTGTGAANPQTGTDAAALDQAGLSGISQDPSADAAAAVDQPAAKND